MRAAEKDLAKAIVPLADNIDSFLVEHCLDCHSEGDDADLSGLDFGRLARLSEATALADAEKLEAVLGKLKSRQMPPLDSSRPSDHEYNTSTAALEKLLDLNARLHPSAGRTATLRRLTRFEYQNAIRDLLAIPVNASELLPPDSSSGGFDNITVGDLSPTRINRYIAAAEKISRLAVGVVGKAPTSTTFRIKPDITQKAHVPGLPFGTRGGGVFPVTFVRSGRYRIELRLARDRNEHVEGMRGSHDIAVLIGKQQVGSFTVRPPKGGDHSQVDAGLSMEIDVAAGPRDLGVTFIDKGAPLLETMRQPVESRYNMHRHPRQNPALYEVSVTGPVGGTNEPASVVQTPSRQLIFGGFEHADESERARAIIKRMARRAFRRKVTDDDVMRPLHFYHSSREAGGSFDEAIQASLSAILVSPNFLLRVEPDPSGVESGSPYRISDVQLASRLSFFLWSSIPDEELLTLAIDGQLSRPENLTEQTLRMLADPKAESLTKNFAAQWLYLRNLDSFTPDGRLFPDFDDNLRQAFRAETEMLFSSVVSADESVLHLLDADYTFLNERLAKHYGISGVFGSHFRRVDLPDESKRGGLLRHGSLLTVTSYATRTSPVIRGYWILKNLLGAPPPPPPDDVPALEDNTVAANLTLRERLAEHRANPACASCHDIMDPIGFSLENYDAIGRWREREFGANIDASGGFPDGSEFDSVQGLEQALLRRPEQFVTTLVKKLAMYAIGRPMQYHDGPAIRKIVRDASDSDYQFSKLILGIVHSDTFLTRRAE
ncbi:MAG: hypothetical protein Aurels2KO_12480 [Aureliella sp.]